MDPKVFNLLKFLFLRIGAIGIFIYLIIYFSGELDLLKLVGGLTLAIIVWRGVLSVYRRKFQPPKQPLAYGKWAIVTGSTSGIGAAFADYLAGRKMNILVISRTESKLQQQCKDLESKYGIRTEYLAYDFTDMGPARAVFYKSLDETCKRLSVDGGVGLLINNVGTANEIPKTLDEFADEEVDNILNCNIFSTIFMTRTVLKFMKERKNGCIVSISSGSGNHPGPFLALYSATKAFMTQFSRSMHVECWGTGVDFLVVTPFYIVSNLYKRKSGTLIAPMPSELIEGTMAQLGKKMVWQGHGYWFHGLIGNIASYYWGTTARYRKMMMDNRKRYDERQSAKKAQ